MADQWEYELEWNSGAIRVLATNRRHFPSPVVSARRFGRFALELWIGHELIERIRFDFPGLAVDAPPAPGARASLYPAPDLSRGAQVRQKLLVPASPRARRAMLVDRATGQNWPLPWPPDNPLPPPTRSVSPAATQSSGTPPSPVPAPSTIP